MDLDKMIIEKRIQALSESSLDGDYFQEDVNIHQIYADILTEAVQVKTGDLIHKDKIQDTKVVPENGDHSKMIVSLKELLDYEDENFVTECYRKILGREPDRNGLQDQLHRLRMQELTKTEIIYNICKSPEGQMRGVVIQGIEMRYKCIVVLKKGFKIPVVGRIGRYIWKFFQVNKTIYRISVWGENTTNKLNVEELKLQQIHAEVQNMLNIIEQKIQIQNEKELWLKCEYSALRSMLNQRLDEINTLEENIRNNNILLDKHDQFINQYNREDGQILQKLIVNWCNLQTSIDNNENNIGDVKSSNSQINVSKDKYFSIDYFDFENSFRGSREHIKKIQKIYLPYFSGKRKVVDLGCGRGEFVELLLENQVGVFGIDMYQPYVEYCKMLSLPVEQGDAICYLKNQRNLDGIFVGQVVEHLEIEQIIELCQVAYEKLEKGCYLIMETPNPTSLAIYTEAFYEDPSHNKPVHPRTLKYLAEKAGFSEVEILYTESSRMPYSIPALDESIGKNVSQFNQAMRRVSALLYGSQDYALIAKK